MFRQWLITRLGGIVNKETFIDSLTKKDREVILTEAVTKLFNTIGPEDIFKNLPDGTATFQGRQLSLEQRTSLKEEAKHFLDSFLFRIVDAELKYRGNLSTFFNAATTEDVIHGKLIAWVWDAVKDRLKNI